MNIIELARQAGLHIATDVHWMPIISLEYAEKFAALVEAAARADEREECIKLIHEGTGEPVQIRTLVILQKERKRIADAIQARGTT